MTVTREDLVILAGQIENVANDLTNLANTLEAYKNQQALVTATGELRATTANISGALSALEANITDIDCATIDVSDVANIERLVAQAAQIAGTLDADRITSSDINSANIEASVATIGRLIATTAEIDNWVVGIMTANRVDAVLGNITTVNSETVNTEDLNVTDTLVADKLQTRDFEVTTADIAGAKIGTLENSKLVWKDYVTINDPDDFYIEIPHFENGVYYIHGSSGADTLFTVEISNSIDNYMVRVSQKVSGYLLNIYQYGEGSDAKLYFKVNVNGASLRLKYACTSASNVGAPQSYNTLPVVPAVIYTVDKQNFTKFFKLVDLANQGGSTGVLTGITTNRHDLATPQFDYDTTSNVLERIYKPDQSVNTEDDVKFNSVDAPFLNVAELEVGQKVAFPNIYNGPELTSAQIAALPNKTLYLPNVVATGTTIPGVRMNKNSQPFIDFSSTLDNLILGRTFEKYGPYKTTDGYTVDTSSPAINTQWVIPAEVQCLVVDSNNHYRWLSAVASANSGYLYDITFTSGILTATAHSDAANFYRDSTQAERTSLQDLYEGSTFYVVEGLNEYTMTVVYKNITLESTLGLPYTHVENKAASINIKDANGLHSVVPYDEVSTVADPVDDTHPLVYDTTTDTIKKSTGDITVEGDLSVVGDTTFGGDVTVSGSLNINDETVLDTFHVRGDSFLDGEVVASDDVHIKGDLIVDGKTYTTEEESIETSSNYAVLRKNNPSPLGANEKSGIVVHNYATSKNAFIGVDRDGTFRISDNAAEQTTTYTDVLYYNGTYTPSVSISGAITAQDMDQFDEVVLDNGTYYHWNNSKWFELVYDSVADAYSYDYTDPVTDATLIAALDLLTKADFAYFRSLSVMTVNDATNQPLLTRAEETDLQNNDILVWDETNKKAVNAVRPVQSNTVLTAKVSSGATVHWAGITFTATGMASMLYKFPETDDTVFMDLELQPINKPTVPTGASDVIHTYNDFLYYTETNKIVSYDSVADKYYEVFFNANGTCTVDQYQTIIGDPTKLKACTITSEKIDNDHGVTYEWKSGGSGSVSRFATLAEAQAAIAIPEGQDGYIPNNGIIIVDELNSYVTGENR